MDQDRKTLNKTILEVREKNQLLRIKEAQLENQVINHQGMYLLTTERCDAYEKKYDKVLKDNSDEKDRYSHLMVMTAKKESKIDELSDILSTLRESLERLKQEINQKNIEQEVWKQSEARAIRESEDYLRQRNSAMERINDLQRIFDEKTHENEKMLKQTAQSAEDLSKELKIERRQVSNLMDDLRTITARREAELKDSQIKIERFTIDLEKLRTELASSINSEDVLKSRIRELTKKNSDLEEKLLSYKGRELSYPGIGSSHDEASITELALSQAK